MTFYFHSNTEFMFGSVASIFLLLIGNRTKNISPYFLDGIAFISAVVCLALLTPNFFEISKVNRIWLQTLVQPCCISSHKRFCQPSAEQ